MINVIEEELQKIVDNIKAGNSNIEEDKALEIMIALKGFTDKTKKLSKYQACRYLNVSRSTFDKYVDEGLLPKGMKEPGFKEIFWTEKVLDDFIRSRKQPKK